MAIILSNLNRFITFFIGRFLGKLVVNWLSEIPPFLAYVATLPCENINVRKLAINDKLQCSVATYIRCDGVVNNQIKKGLLLSLSMSFVKPVKIWQSYTQEGGCLVHFARLANTLLKKEESARDNHVVACNFAEKFVDFKNCRFRPTFRHIAVSFSPRDKVLHRNYVVCYGNYVVNLHKRSRKDYIPACLKRYIRLVVYFDLKTNQIDWH